MGKYCALRMVHQGLLAALWALQPGETVAVENLGGHEDWVRFLSLSVCVCMRMCACVHAPGLMSGDQKTPYMGQSLLLPCGAWGPNSGSVASVYSC